KLERVHIYSREALNQPAALRREPMAFKPNYRRDRAERQRAARARTEEKQRKKEEKAALRKAEREAAEAPPDEKQTTGKPGGLRVPRNTAIAAQRMSQDLQSLSASGAATTGIHAPVRVRRQAPRRQTFDSDAIQRLYESDDYPMQRPAPD